MQIITGRHQQSDWLVYSVDGPKLVSSSAPHLLHTILVPSPESLQVQQSDWHGSGMFVEWLVPRAYQYNGRQKHSEELIQPVQTCFDSVGRVIAHVGAR